MWKHDRQCLKLDIKIEHNSKAYLRLMYPFFDLACFSWSSPAEITNINYAYANMIEMLKNTNLAFIKMFITSKGIRVKESTPGF